ncbi:MAG: phytanoyl-CoA dioxygenase family protein, partial [Pseudomonadota bacterium]|nr:phytanoyl-CoA dioxygenase family protein [Pseudomonadota bacterium]
MRPAPVALACGVVDAATCAAWLAAIDAHPAWQRRDAAIDGAFNVQSSSLRIGAMSALDPAAIAAVLLRSEVGALCNDRLGEALMCDVDQCWVRRQYAPSRYPPGHSPHAWHQDGALGFDFLGSQTSPAAGGLLAMVTCWVALTDCGADAPGLEWIDGNAPGLLAPAALHHEALRSLHGEAAFRRPVMRPGDGLAFTGNVLHHTHVSSSMRQDRTSLEIRLFDAARIPARLHGDRFVAVPRELQRIS